MTGAEAVILIVAALTPVDFGGGSHGFFLLGGSCQIWVWIGRLIGPTGHRRRLHVGGTSGGSDAGSRPAAGGLSSRHPNGQE